MPSKREQRNLDKSKKKNTLLLYQYHKLQHGKIKSHKQAKRTKKTSTITKSPIGEKQKRSLKANTHPQERKTIYHESDKRASPK